jgi:hypothetical protein
MEGVQTVDVSWLHHSQKGQCPVRALYERALGSSEGGTQRPR